MIHVDKVSDTVFQVAITGIDFRCLTRMMLRINVSSDEVVRGMLMICLWAGCQDSVSERSQDELDGKDEGMGRR